MESAKSISEGDCSICLEALDFMGLEGFRLQCNHEFHAVCIAKWQNINMQGEYCPICRRPLKQNQEPDITTNNNQPELQITMGQANQSAGRTNAPEYEISDGLLLFLLLIFLAVIVVMFSPIYMVALLLTELYKLIKPPVDLLLRCCKSAQLDTIIVIV